ncbi:MAG TPA: tyrosine-type recombinase/integrase [Thermoanaerobaculaceae bacterium]|nr:tyrosine-type recombinase/integrase [Thermoanaerobaculaceae bacterium]
MPSKRRGNREGSIVQRKDGRWQGQASFPDGRRKTVYGKTRETVAGELLKLLTAERTGAPVPGHMLTVGRHLTRWLENVKPEVRFGTWRRYEQLVRAHLEPALGKVRLSRLTPNHLRDLFAAKAAAGLAPATIRHMRAVLRIALQAALRDGDVVRNVATLTRPPKASQNGAAPMRALTKDQARQLLEVAAFDRLSALYWLALTTGARQGELLALSWQAIDLRAGTMRIAATLQRTAEGLTLAATKTDASRRVVTLTPGTVAALRRHRARQAKERAAADKLWTDSGLVFTSEIGTPLEAGNVLRRSFWPLLLRLGLAERITWEIDAVRRGKPVKVQRSRIVPHLRFHDLRHSAATLLLETGMHPSVVAAMLGHSKTSTTLNVYSHVTPSLAAQATSRMAELLS